MVKEYFKKSIELHRRFKSWKPIHLCWWFEKHGLPIPPYLIGTGADKPSVSDTTTMSELVTVTVSDPQVSVSDTTNITELVSAVVVNLESVSDTTNITEVVTISITSNINVSDTTIISDIAGEPDNTVFVFDQVQLSIIDLGVNPNVSDTTAITESIQLQIVSFLNVSDTTAITESVTMQLVSYISVSETTNITELIMMQVLSVINVSDTTNITELVTLQVISNISVSDTSIITENVTLQLVSYPSVSDTTTITESVVIQLVSYISISDTTNITDTSTIRIGPIFFDATSSSGYEASLSTYNWQHTVGNGSNGILMIGVAVLATGQVSSITAGSKSAVKLRSDVNGVYRSELWYVINPDVGQQTITVNLSTSLTSITGAVSYFGVDQDNPFDDNAGTSGVGGSATLNIATYDDLDTVLGLISTSSGAITVGSGQVERINSAGALGSLGIDDRQWITPPATKIVNWTGIGVLDSWAISAASLIPSVDILNVDTVSDTTNITESVTVNIRSFISVQDTTGITESESIQVLVATNVQDSTNVTDSVIIEVVTFENTSETTNVSDSVSIIIIDFISTSDTTNITEGKTIELISQGITPSEVTTVSENVQVSIITLISISDTTALSEAIYINVYRISVSDTTIVTDVFSSPEEVDFWFKRTPPT